MGENGTVKPEKGTSADNTNSGANAENTASNNNNAKNNDNNDGDVKHINLSVRSQQGDVVHFKIKKHTALKKLLNAYCQRANLERHAVRFRHDGQPVQDEDTPLSLQMEEDDVIEAFARQEGGDGGG